MIYLEKPYTREALARLTVTDSGDSAGLRSHVRRDQLASGSQIVSMNRDACIALMLGEAAPVVAMAAPRAMVGAAPSSGDAASMLADALRVAMASQTTPLDEEAVRAIAAEVAAEVAAEKAEANDARVAELVARLMAAAPVVENRKLDVTINGGATNTVEGLRHFQYTQVLTWLASGVPLWLWGGAGAGKTTLARQLAAGLGVLPYVISIDPTATMGKLVGYRNLVNGEYVEGLLYRAYRDGGLVCLDEIDTGDASIIAGLNSLLANGHFLFPNGETVEKHAQFFVMAGANTKGTGAVGWFSARVKLDGATLDRFACVELKYDEGLELAICCNVASTTKEWAKVAHNEARCAKWVKWVQAVRAQVGNALLVSPRASQNGCRALRAGIPVSEVAEALVFKLATPETAAAIVARVGNPSSL